jgi:hypothetical protein
MARETAEKVAPRSAAATQSASFEPLFEASNRLLETWMVMGTEILEFGKTRLDHSVELGKAMARSATLNEALEAQRKFTRTMVQDYINETNKLADLSTRTLLESFAVTRPAAPAAPEGTTTAPSGNPRMAAE